jgi:hypothetical protein
MSSQRITGKVKTRPDSIAQPISSQLEKRCLDKIMGSKVCPLLEVGRHSEFQIMGQLANFNAPVAK